MSIIHSVDNYVSHKRFGKVFTFDQVIKCLPNNYLNNSVSSALSKKVKSGQLRRISHGLYYRPKKNRFGYEPLKIEELIKGITKTGKIAYVVSGLAAVNELGLSTQLPISKTYIISKRVRVHVSGVKLVYSKSLQSFDDSLKIHDRSQRDKALLLWSALKYIDKKKIDTYRKDITLCIKTFLSEDESESFFNAMPPSMKWVKILKGNVFEQVSWIK